MGDLYSRLKRMQRCGRPADGPADGPVDRAANPDRESGPGFINLDGWMRVDDMVFRRDTCIPIETPAAAPGGILISGAGERPLLFWDTETTGLSGGAGTTIFLVGVGAYVSADDGPPESGSSGAAVRITQLLLGDFPGEPSFLAEAQRVLSAEAAWVSYNGRAFDSRLFATRCLMNGLIPPEPEQLDLLYWARRLWKRRIGGCTLGDIEREVLRMPRGPDIPGIEIPSRYFEFLTSRDGRVLEQVFEHHRRDIVSLVRLCLRVESILADPLAATKVDPSGGAPVDRYELARWLISSGRDEDTGVELLRLLVEQPYPAEEPLLERAAILLSRRLRRAGGTAAAIDAVDRALALTGRQSAPLTVELAKLFEHRLREPERALEAMEALLKSDPALYDAPSIRRRVERLTARVARRRR